MSGADLPREWLEGLASLERDGYARIPSVFRVDRLATALDLVRHWAERTVAKPRHNPPSMGGGAVVWNLQNKDSLFLDLLFEEPLIERILMRLLNDPWYRAIPDDAPNYIMRAYIARAGMDGLPLHIDSFVPYAGPFAISVQCVIPLEPMRPGSGATRIVPGSHQAAAWADRNAGARAVSVEAAPGDLLLWDSRLWHGAESNSTGISRWALIATFTRWWIKQAFRIPDALPHATRARLSPRHLAVLGFCSQPFLDEEEGIRTQQGYEAIADLPITTAP